MPRLALLLPILLLPACATVVNGTNQSVTVETLPAGASCAVDRAGVRVGVVPQTPGSLVVDKSRHDLMVTCGKPGYQTTAVTQASSFNGWTFGNILIGGAVGLVVDAATGANYDYPRSTRFVLGGATGGYAPYAGYPRVGYGSPYAYAGAFRSDPVASHAASY